MPVEYLDLSIHGTGSKTIAICIECRGLDHIAVPGLQQSKAIWLCFNWTLPKAWRHGWIFIYEQFDLSLIPRSLSKQPRQIYKSGPCANLNARLRRVVPARIAHLLISIAPGSSIPVVSLMKECY